MTDLDMLLAWLRYVAPEQQLLTVEELCEGTGLTSEQLGAVLDVPEGQAALTIQAGRRQVFARDEEGLRLIGWLTVGRYVPTDLVYARMTDVATEETVFVPHTVSEKTGRVAPAGINHTTIKKET